MNPILKDFVQTLLVPLLINKAIMVFFGLKYAENPGEGYGYGLVATIIFLFLGLGRFLWKYKDIQDP